MRRPVLALHYRKRLSMTIVMQEIGVQMEFVYADTLKTKFDVFGHFYNLTIGQDVLHCRSSLDIVSKSIRNLANQAPDAVVVMMNPGSSVPLAKGYSPRQYSLDEIFSRNWEKEIVCARADNAQYQIMRLMTLNDWKYVKILNLSDLRNGNSGNFANEFKRAAAIDSSNPHCITHEGRRAELMSSLETKSNGLVIAAWGSIEVLRESASRMIAYQPVLTGIKLGDPWFKYPRPYMKDQKLEWLMNMDAVVKQTAGKTINHLGET